LVCRIPDGVVVVNDGVCYGAVMRGGAHGWGYIYRLTLPQ
jgi:hypothetical protein